MRTMPRVRWQCEVELGPDHHVRADQRPHAGEQIALAVLAAVGDHGAVQRHQDDLDRQGAAQLIEQPVAQRLPRRGGS